MTPPAGPPVRVERVCLIGYRGSGKSSVGRLLAARLGWEWIDTDERIAMTTGRSIREIFATEGEPAFRALEKAAVIDALSQQHAVISVGGGAVLDADSRRRMHDAALCVWLTAPVEILHERLAADPRGRMERPRLTELSELEEIRALLTRRAPYYREAAQLALDTGQMTIEQAADQISQRLAAARAEPDACPP
ncbi:Shikimate kinase 2 [Phycisphaerae bacterium RAS1]|nr:Shikimate kinase 2 [Phycisphaerae bacterium RAS1]